MKLKKQKTNFKKNKALNNQAKADILSVHQGRKHANDLPVV